MSLLGFDAIGRLALGQIRQAGPTTIVMAAAPGSFALSGVAVTFRVTEAAVSGAYTLTGFAAPLVIKEAVAAGSFALSGVSASLRVLTNAAPGAYVLTGYPINEPITEKLDPGSFILTGNDAKLIRTGADFDLTYGGIGHFLYEREKARKLAAITRKAPSPIDRRSAPQFQPLARPHSAPIAPAPDMAAIQNQRMAAQAAAVRATKKRRELEAILLLAS